MEYEELVQYYSENLQEISPGGVLPKELADTFLQKRVLEQLARGLSGSSRPYENLELPEYRGVLFSGPAGSGKRTLCDSLIAGICRYCGARPGEAALLRLRADDFPERGPGAAEAIGNKLQAIFEAAEASDYRWRFLVFDQLERYGMPLMTANYLGDLLKDQGPARGKVFVLCLTERAMPFCRELLSTGLLFHCSCALPVPEQRKLFFKTRLKWLVENWENPGEDEMTEISLQVKGFEAEDFVRHTDGWSFGELTQLVAVLKLEAAGSTLKFNPNGTVSVNLDRETVVMHMHSVHPEEHRAVVGVPVMQQASAAVPAQGNNSNLMSKDASELTIDDYLQLIMDADNIH